MSGLADLGQTVDVVYLDFSSACSMVSHVIPLVHLVKYGFVRWIVK